MGKKCLLCKFLRCYIIIACGCRYILELKTVWKIIWRTFVGLFLAVYCLVALANFSLVQSYAATEVGRRLSEAWGGKVKIGSLHANPIDHLIANNLLMVAPDGDTILDAKVLRVRFHRFPYRGDRLELQSVYLRDAYYRLITWEPGDTTAPDYVRNSPLFATRPGINMQHIIDYYYRGPLTELPPPFTVDVKNVILRNVHYKMDLPEHNMVAYDNGVVIPHMEFYDIHGKITNVHVVNDDVTCRLVRLKTVERSGFRAENISSSQIHVGQQDITVTDLYVETDRSRIMVDTEIKYDGWESLADYLNTAYHNIDIKEGTSVAMSDIAFWAPVLWGIDVQLMPCGNAEGTISDMRIPRMDLRFGHASDVYVAGDIKGLPDVEQLCLDLQALDIRFEESDITSLMAQMPRYITPQVAGYLRQIQYIDLTAQASGSLNGSCTANLNMVCGLGNLRADMAVRPARRGRHIVLNANSDGLGLTPLGSDWLTHSGLDLNLEADIPNRIKGIQSLNAQADMTLNGSVVRGNRLDPVVLHASLEEGNATVTGECNDSLVDFSVLGHIKLADSLRGYHVDLQLNHLDAEALGLTSKQYGDMGTHLVANFKGNELDGMSGGAVAYRTHVGDMKMRELKLNVISDGIDKRLQLESDALTATVNGRFLYSDLPVMFQSMSYDVLPVELGLVPQPDSTVLVDIAANTMNFHLRWTDESGLLQKLVPGLNVAGGTRIDGAYNSTEMLRLVGRGDWLDIGGIHLGGIGLQTGHHGGNYTIEVESQTVNVGDFELFEEAVVSLACSRDGAEMGLRWGDSTQHTTGDLLFSLSGGDIRVLRPYFNVGNSQWQVGADGMHIEMQPQFAFVADRFSLESDQQHINARMRLMNKDNDCVELNFDNFGLSLLSDLFLQNTPLDVEGWLNGRFSLYGLATSPYFNANMSIDSSRLNRQELGRLSLLSTWNAEMNTLNLQLGGNTLNALGWLELGTDNPDINFGIDFNRFELATIAPLLSEFSSRFEGQLEGQIDISGKLNQPTILGEAYIDGGALMVDVTGVTYFFNDSIEFNNNRVTLRNFLILDQLGNTANVDGEIRYHDLENLEYNLSLNTDNLLVLSQRNGDDFYGTLLVQADGTVSGGVDRIDIGLRARTNPGSSLTVPISDRRQVHNQNFIIFVGDDEQSVASQSTSKTGGMDFDLEVDLTITPDLQLDLPMSFSEVSVGVKGSGNRDLHLSLTETLEPEVQGNYEISSGSLKLGVASMIEKTFSLEQGSSLNFQGSLPDALFDLQAVYSQRVNLSTLTGSLSAVDNTQKYIQVENVIAIAGTLTEPTLRFDLRLPGADASVEEEVFSYVDRNSERDMLNQTMSLLLMGSFYNVGGNMNENANLLSSGLSSGYSMVASTMGNMVSDMVQVVDVDFKYKAATEMTNEQVDLNISKDWGRFYLKSTLGYGGDSRELEDNANGNAVIDALLGYRITPLIHVYAYNRTNNNDYTRLDLPYKQGAGIKLTKDFDHWGDLFIRRKEKTKKEK